MLFLLLCLIFGWLLEVTSKSFEALDQTVWRSRAVVHVDDNDHNDQQAPFLCEFYDIEIDPVTIFFKARNHTTAVLDLYQCCSKSENNYDGNCTNTSVHKSFCRCFYYERYFPSVYHKEEGRQKHLLLGTTWLMNHYAWVKNPDHFMMKILEFRALMANQPYVPDTNYKVLPASEEIDQLVSQDYPASILTDYEKFLMNVVDNSVNRTIPYISLNDKNRMDFHDYLTNTQKLHISCRLLRSQKVDQIAIQRRKTIFSEIMEYCEKKAEKVIRLTKIWHGTHVYLSPRYKNNIPDPVEISTKTFQESIDRMMHSLNHTWDRNERAICYERKPTIAVLQRIEGFGSRSILNLIDVGRAVRKIFGIVELRIWYIAEDTSALEQATLFHSADIIIATHSSQLTNLVFSRPGTHVIEIQPEIAHEYSFRDLGLAAGMDYYLLNEGHQYDKTLDDGKSETSLTFTWRLWDYYVNITMLSEALQTIKAKNLHCWL